MKKALVFLSVFFSLVLVFDVYSQDTTPTRPVRPGQERREERMQQQQTRVQERCARIAQNIDNRVKAFTNVKDRRLNSLAKFQKRLEELVNNLKEKHPDIETTAVVSALEGLDPLRNTFANDFDAFLADLAKVKDIKCEQVGDNPLRAAIQDSKDKLETVRQDAKNIRDYYQTTIKPAFNSLRNQLRS